MIAFNCSLTRQSVIDFSAVEENRVLVLGRIPLMTPVRNHGVIRYGFGGSEALCRNTIMADRESRGCFTNDSRALQNNFVKIYNARNHIYGGNFKLEFCTCVQSIALGTCTKFQLKISHEKYDFCNTHISREYFEEFLVKQPPGLTTNRIMHCKPRT